MKDDAKTKAQLIAELEELRTRIGVLQAAAAEGKRAAEALRLSEERYRLLADNVEDFISLEDAEGRHLYVSPSYYRLTGWTPEDLAASGWRTRMHPEDLPTIERAKATTRAGQAVKFEHRIRRRDGSWMWVEQNWKPILDADGKMRQTLLWSYDITERKRAEAALEQERQSLWQMLQAGDHERQTISYEIHDGLAQYLGGAIMQFQAYEALRENAPQEADRAYQTATELVRQSHAEARRLISEVRPPVIDEIGLETAISHLVHEQRLHGGPKIQLDSDVQFGRLPAILENALYRIAQEALHNACKHSKSKKVKVSLRQEDPQVRLEVQDWGIGFDPQAIAPGRFGLESMRQRVRLLGGQLKIESAPGAGALIQALVPIVERLHDAPGVR